MLKTISVFHNIRKWFLSLCYSSEVEYSVISVCKRTTSDEMEDIDWQASVPNDCIFIEALMREYLGETQTKYRVFYNSELYVRTRKENVSTVFNERIVSPWLWIGDGDISMIDKLEPFLVPGNVIRPSLLKVFFPSINHWKYMDPKTFEMTEFPEDGITIKRYVSPRLETIAEDRKEE